MTVAEISKLLLKLLDTLARLGNCSLAVKYGDKTDWTDYICRRHLSCEEDRGEVARLLVERGAQLDAVNKEKKTPLELASMALAKTLRSMVSP